MSRSRKDHLLWSPKKNYLGNWDLPENGDLTLTIASGAWEIVKNPTTNKEEEKRIIRFVEKGYKPLICNATNAKRILSATGITYLPDLKGKNKRINLYKDTTYSQADKMNVPCVRVRSIYTSPELPELEDSGIESAVTWILKNKTNIAGFKKIRKETPKQEKELQKLIKIANEKD